MKIRQDMNNYKIDSNIRKLRLENNLTHEQTDTKIQFFGIEISRSLLHNLNVGFTTLKCRNFLL